MSEYQFTQNWFCADGEEWLKIAHYIPERKSFLEIGSFEGRSTVWTIQNLMADGGDITCIDTWQGSEEHEKQLLIGVEERFHHNISIVRQLFPYRSVFTIKNTSFNALCKLNQESKRFDFIYIDGSHVAKDVMTDACLCWPLLKSGGVLVFDDYLWKWEGPGLRKPKLAVDMFAILFEYEMDIIHNGYQVIVRKIV